MTAIPAATPRVEPAPLNGVVQAASQSKASRARDDAIFSEIEREIARKKNAPARDENAADKDGAELAPSAEGDRSMYPTTPEQGASSCQNILATMTLVELRPAPQAAKEATVVEPVDGNAASLGHALVGIDLGEGALAAANLLSQADGVANNVAPSRSVVGSLEMVALTPENQLRKSVASDDGEHWPVTLVGAHTNSCSNTPFARPDTASRNRIRLSVEGFETHFPLALTQIVPNALTSSAPMERVDVDIRLQPMVGVEQPAAPARVLTFQLEPESLGTIAVRMKLIHTRVELQIWVDNIDALALLTESRDDLVRAISAGGHSVEGISVKVSSAPALSDSRRSDAGAGDFTNSVSGHESDGGKRGGGGQMDNGTGSRRLAGSSARFVAGIENEPPCLDNASHVSSVYL